MNRREFLGISTGVMAALAAGGSHTSAKTNPMRRRRIPRTGEEIPVIGLGTARTFDVGRSPADRAPLAEVLRRFFADGGRVIDTSPMYGRAESVAGDLVTADRYPAFFATKVWTTGLDAGKAQMQDSMRRLRTDRVDLMQVHNLVDWKTQLASMRTLREQGKLRYVGITHYALDRFELMERILRTERLDFVQLPYSAKVRAAETRLLPAAADTGTAVLVMRPFEEGELFEAVRGRPLPEWARERGFESWAQLFLEFILAHPAVTCAIPATAKPQHMSQNLQAGRGPELDADLKRKLVSELGV